MFERIANFTTLLKQAREVSGRVQQVQDRLREERLVGSAGGGLAEAEVNGLGDVVRLRIDPQLVERGEREMIEDLLAAAVNDALAKSKQRHVELMREVVKDIPLPGVDSALAQWAGGEPPAAGD